MWKPKDWGQPCPNPECVHYRRMQQGNVSATATYLTQSGKRRIFRCHTCETPFSETRETVFFDLRTSEDKVMMALKMLLVRVDVAGIGFVLEVTEETVPCLARDASRARVHPSCTDGPRRAVHPHSPPALADPAWAVGTTAPHRTMACRLRHNRPRANAPHPAMGRCA